MVSENYTFNGKYAKYVKELTGKNSDVIKYPIFSTYYKAYLFSAIYGVLNNCRMEYNPHTDNINNEEPATIRSEVFNNGSGNEDYRTIRKIVLLMDVSRNMTSEQRIDSAMRYDFPKEDGIVQELNDKSMYDRNTELFNQYVLGGLTLIYDKVSSLKSMEDYLTFVCNFKENFEESIGKKESGEILFEMPM